MPSLKEVRIRITSVKSTQQITSAMKMVSASKLRKAQTNILQLRPFAAHQKLLLQQLTSGTGAGNAGKYSEQREDGKTLYVIFTSNRGLCGAYNANVIKQMNALAAGHRAENSGSPFALITIGRKATEFFAKLPVEVLSSHDELYDQLNFASAVPIAENLIQRYLSGEFSKVVFVYHQFRNAVVQYLQTEQFLPVESPEATGNEGHGDIEYIFDPSKEEILQQLIPQILKTQFYKALLDSWASEQGARMTAMSQATDNASELLKELKLTYNKARQAAITKEILEIVGGAEALKNS